MSWGVKDPGGHGRGDHIPVGGEQLVKMDSQGLGSHQCLDLSGQANPRRVSVPAALDGVSFSCCFLRDDRVIKWW